MYTEYVYPYYTIQAPFPRLVLRQIDSARGNNFWAAIEKQRLLHHGSKIILAFKKELAMML
jgi:hypothetical protein